MPRLSRSAALPLILVAAISLSACKSDEEKAADYFASGQALLAQGDEDRALVEFRNVFKYDPFHLEARKTYADVLVKRNELEEAYSQYLRLIEQYPDTAEVRLILAELAIKGSNWEEAERHGREAIRLAPDLPGVKAVQLTLDYRLAALDKDNATRTRLAEAARALLKDHPDSTIARRIVIDEVAAGADPAQALPLIEEALALEPQSLEYHMMKFLLLNQTGQVEATGAQLKTMFGLFPDNAEVRNALISWHMAQKDYDGAETFLRQIAGEATGQAVQHMALVQFLQTFKGTEAARAELQSLITANGEGENAQMYRAMLASMDYDSGDSAKAIADLSALVASAQPGEQTRRIKGMLARMMDATGDRPGAAKLVEEILAEDHTHAVALKLRATWSIGQDDMARAIQDLNTALTSAPRDPEVFTLLALAQSRDGNTDRVGELLAQATEASGAAPAESLRYATFLTREGNFRQAEITLLSAWQLAPGNQDILRMLAELFIGQKKWPQAQTAIDFLDKTGVKGLDPMRATILEGQGKIDEALAILQAQIDRGEEVPAAAQAALQILMRKDDAAGARAFLDEVLKRDPQNRDLRLLSAGLRAQGGDLAAAEATYRELIAEKADDEPPYRLLYSLLESLGRTEEAQQVLDAGLAALPGAYSLQWLKAVELERAGKVEDAIKLYEALYARDGSDILVANNLASLIATYRDDPASLARAEAISRRLRGQDNPALQDTYGWIAFLNGNTYGAIAHLEPAAKGLPNDALTQYHLGKLYQSMDRAEDAIAQYDKALSLAATQPVIAALPQIADAKAQRDALKAKLEESKSP